MKSPITKQATNKWQRYTGLQKMFIVYAVLLLVLFVLLPVLKIDPLNTTSVDTYTIFSGGMTKVWVLTLLIIVFLIARNASFQFKRFLHRIFGFRGNDVLVNTTLLFMLLVLLFGVGETTSLFKQNFSYRISTTTGFVILGTYIIIGIAVSLAAARIQHKKYGQSQEINVTTENHDESNEDSFHQEKKDLGGLFDEDEE